MKKRKLKPQYIEGIDIVDPVELVKGAIHEFEHTDDVEVATKIAMDHLREDPYYYAHLEKMERQYKKKRK